MRRPARRDGSPSAAGCRPSKANLRPRAADVIAEQERVAAAEAALAAAAPPRPRRARAARDAQRATDAAREEHAAAEREISRNAARISALQEARQRTTAGRDEAVGGAPRSGDGACRDCRRRPSSKSRLATVNETIARDRGALAEVRVEAQAIAREAELASRRLQAIAAERAAWDERETQRRRTDRHHRRADRGGETRARRTRQRAGEIRQVSVRP